MSGRRRSSGQGQSSLGYLFGNSSELEQQGNDLSKVSSPPVSISGGGQSSLGYLFGTSNASEHQSNQKSRLPSPPVSLPPYGIEVEAEEKPPEKSVPLPSENTMRYVYHKVDAESSSNFLMTGRPSTRVKSVPGGDSSVGYLFGDK